MAIFLCEKLVFTTLWTGKKPPVKTKMEVLSEGDRIWLWFIVFVVLFV
jgi:hypothetical protein